MSQEKYYIGSDKIWLSLETITPISMRRLTFGVARVRKERSPDQCSVPEKILGCLISSM